MRVGWLVVLLSASAWAQNATTPGTASSPFPTIEHLSLEWPISGDADNDSVVTVRFRKQGDAAWRTGLPLFRVPAGSSSGFSWGNRHAGSLFGLEPGTTYEVELTLVDPDGGGTTQTLTATTRVEPQASPTGRVRAVTPSTIGAALSSLLPGDILVLASGSYAAITVGTDGTAAAPIALRSEVPEGAVITGNVGLFSRQHIILEGLAINGTVRVNDAQNVTVRRCRITTTTSGITGYGEPRNLVVVDNVVTGATTFSDATVGANGNNVGEGIELSGPGHVICFNRVRGFRDAISTLEDAEAHNQQSVDICNNDIEIGADDGIEADFTMGNVRVLRNRIRNSFVGISGQPSLGGPAYYVRNVMENVIYTPFKLHRGSVGDVALHNTVVKSGDAFAVYAGVTWSRAFFRNNLFLGGQGGGTYGGYSNGTGRVAQLADADGTCNFDYDGYGSVGTGSFQGRIGATSFNGLAQLRATTTEAHAVQVDLAVFAQPPVFPSSGPFPEQPVMDLRLAPGGAAIDVGVALANINDGFAGAAPDLGAVEAGSTEPLYGPRPMGAGGGTGGGGGATGGGGGATGGGGGATGGGGGGATGGGGGATGGGGGATGGGTGGATGGGGGGMGGGAEADAGVGGGGGEAAMGGCGCGSPGAPLAWVLTALLATWWRRRPR